MPTKLPSKYPTEYLVTMLSTDRPKNGIGKQMHSENNNGILNMNPVYYIFIACAVIIFMTGCICCIMISLYFKYKRVKTVEDIKIAVDKQIANAKETQQNEEEIYVDADADG
eukprot:219500_1